jgi:hypothetical protein
VRILRIIFTTLVFTVISPSFVNDEDNLIYEGEKFRNIELQKSNKEDVIRLFGKNYHPIYHDDYSTEMKYKDFSFTYKNADTSKKIYWISFENKSGLKTKKGLRFIKGLQQQK